MNQRDNGSTKARLTVRIDNETLHEIERLAQVAAGRLLRRWRARWK